MEAMLGQRRRLEIADAERAAKPIREMLRFEENLRNRIGELREAAARD